MLDLMSTQCFSVRKNLATCRPTKYYAEISKLILQQHLSTLCTDTSFNNYSYNLCQNTPHYM
jgi:hypothetical protein